MGHYTDSLRYYRSYRIRSLLLNRLLVDKEISVDATSLQISARVAAEMDKSLLWKSFQKDVSHEIVFLSAMGYIVPCKEKNVIAITPEGKDTLRNGIIDEAANSAFHNFVNMRLQRKVIWISLLALLLSLVSIILQVLL